MVIKFWISWIIESAVFTYVTMGPPSDKRGIKNTSGNYGLMEWRNKIGHTGVREMIAKTNFPLDVEFCGLAYAEGQ